MNPLSRHRNNSCSAVTLLDALIRERSETIEKLEVEIGRLNQQKEQLKSDVQNQANGIGIQKASESGTIGQARQQRTTKKQEAMQQLLQVIQTKPNATLSELAVEIGRSKSTVGGYLSELQNTGFLTKGKDGWITMENQAS